MSTQFNGLANITGRPAPHNIASSTNASPVEVTTSTPHGLTSGDTVYIQSHATNTKANGVWPVVVVSPTKFTLTGSTGNGVGGATGTAQSLGFDATYAIPSDGDAPDAASVNVAFEALGDRTAWLAERVGPVWLLEEGGGGQDDDTYASWSNNTLSSASWALLASSPAIMIGGVKAGDVIELDFQTTASVSGGTDPCRIAFGENVNGGGWTKIANTGRRLGGTYADGSLRARYTFVGSGGASDLAQFGILGLGGVGSPPVLDLLGDYTISVRVWRPVR